MAKQKKRRKLWYRCLKQIMKIRYKKPTFRYLGEKILPGSIVLSNHEGTDAPMSLEIYCDAPLTMWGAAEMNSGLKKLYKYQTEVYYHEKKHWNIHAARLFCLLASPLTNLFYKGLNLISTYHDARLIGTIKKSVSAIRSGESIVIFPEKSTEGYLKELEGFNPGFFVLATVCLRAGIDCPIYVAYFKKETREYIIDKPVLFSKLIEKSNDKDKICEILCSRCNELGKMEIKE